MAYRNPEQVLGSQSDCPHTSQGPWTPELLRPFLPLRNGDSAIWPIYLKMKGHAEFRHEAHYKGNEASQRYLV